MINKEGEILLNYLLPDYLSKEIGKALLKEMEIFAKQSGLKQIKTTSTITALTFYKKNGFKEVDSNNQIDMGISVFKIIN